MGTKIDDLSAVSTPLGGTEAFACVQTSTKKATAANIAEYAVDVLLGADAADPTTGDNVVAERSGTEKLYDLDDLSAYAVDTAWTANSAATPTVQTGDSLVMRRSGTVYTLDVDELTSYVNTGHQATILDVSGLDEATLSDSDEYLVVQSGTAKKTDFDDIAGRVHAQLATYVAALSAADALADANSFYVLQGGTAKEATMTQLATYMTAEIAAAVVATVWDGDSVSPVLDADVFVLERSDVLKKATGSVLAAYVISQMAEGAAVSPAAAGDDFVIFRSGTQSQMDIDVLAAYVGTEILSEASTHDPVVGTDLVVLDRSGAVAKTDVDTLQTYLLDYSGLAEGTLADSDEYIINQSGTPKKTDWLDIAGRAHSQFAAYSAALDAVSSVGATDKYYTTQAGTAKHATASQIKTYVLNGIQTTALDVSGLDEATLADDDEYLVCQSGTPKKTDWTDIAGRAHSQFSAYLAGLDAADALADANSFYVLQGGTAKEATMSQLSTYAVAEVGTTPVSSAFDEAAVSPALVGDLMLVERSGTLGTATVGVIAAYATSVLSGADAVDPAAAGDDILLFRSGTQKLLDIDVLTDYIETEIIADATATDPALGSYKVLGDNSGVITMTVDVLKTYILTGIQATVLDISSLSDATIDDTDYFFIGEGSNPRHQTAANVAAYTNSTIAAYIDAQDDGDPPVDTDHFPITRSGALKHIDAVDMAEYVRDEIWDQTLEEDPADGDIIIFYRSGTGYLKTTFSDLLDYMEETLDATALESVASGWNIVDTGDYTDTPVSVSRIAISDTTNLEVGMPLRYTYGGTAYYGIVEEVSANAWIDVRGATLDTGSDLTELAYGVPSMATTVRLKIPGAYLVPWYIPDNDANGDGVGDSELDETVLSEIAQEYFTWRGPPAYLVAVAVTQGTVDDTAQPKFGITIDSADVLTEDSNKGIQASGTAGTWTWNSQVAIATGTYKIETGDALEVVCTANGSSGEACDVSLELVFVYE